MAMKFGLSNKECIQDHALKASIPNTQPPCLQVKKCTSDTTSQANRMSHLVHDGDRTGSGGGSFVDHVLAIHTILPKKNMDLRCTKTIPELVRNCAFFVWFLTP